MDLGSSHRCLESEKHKLQSPPDLKNYGTIIGIVLGLGSVLRRLRFMLCMAGFDLTCYWQSYNHTGICTLNTQDLKFNSQKVLLTSISFFSSDVLAMLLGMLCETVTMRLPPSARLLSLSSWWCCPRHHRLAQRLQQHLHVSWKIFLNRWNKYSLRRNLHETVCRNADKLISVNSVIN